MVQTAEQKDQAQLAALIYSAGENNLNFLFSNQAQGYLKFALDSAEGQFGFANQQIIKHGEDLVACGSFWTSEIPQQYHAATLKTLISFFGTEKTVSILHNSAVLAELLSPPLADELGIGHFAVTAKYRKQGFGKAMLDYYVKRAEQLDKAYLVLDVETENKSALNFYYDYGFHLFTTKVANPNAIALNLHNHLNLRFSIK